MFVGSFIFIFNYLGLPNALLVQDLSSPHVEIPPDVRTISHLQVAEPLFALPGFPAIGKLECRAKNGREGRF
jgi:hypothetical protein